MIAARVMGSALTDELDLVHQFHETDHLRGIHLLLLACTLALIRKARSKVMAAWRRAID